MTKQHRRLSNCSENEHWRYCYDSMSKPFQQFDQVNITEKVVFNVKKKVPLIVT